MAGSGLLRTQYPYGGGTLSPTRPLYDFPSPTSNYPSGMGGASPGYTSMAYQNTPRFGSSAFIPPPDVFLEGRKGAVQEPGMESAREFRQRRSDVLSSDPVAMHLLVETAIGDSQYFDVLTVEEVEALKQEQKSLDARLGPVRRKLDSETKIRDAAQSLTRLTSKKDKTHKRGLSRRGSNAVGDTSSRSEEELKAANEKVEDLTRELLEIESRMRNIDAQLLMHTAGVLQLTHNGPTKKVQNSQVSSAGVQRPDSPASLYTYETGRSPRRGEDNFDERSLYRSPENLDSLMNALQNGTHHHTESVAQQSQALTSMSRRLEDLNDRLRELIVQANPERNQQYSSPPHSSSAAADASSVDQQLDFLDQGLRDIGAEHTNHRNNSKHSLNEVEGRLEGINNQLYAMLTKSDESTPPPPPISGGRSQDQLNYLEDSFYNLQQIQYSLDEELDELRSKSTGRRDGDAQYETTLMGLWSIIKAGEEEARQRKMQRRQMLAQDPDADEELSPDEDYNPNEEFSLSAFSAKVQWLYGRASSLKDKQSILIRQIKQQRELNSKSDAQKEEQFNNLKEEVLSARSEKASMAQELERAMGQLHQFDERKIEADSVALRDVNDRVVGLEAQLREAQDAQERANMLERQLQEAQDDARVEAATIQAELSQSAAKIDEAMAALQAATAEKEAAEARHVETSKALNAKEEELQDLEGEVVRLTTELTFAKAELDGAYGTRAERAAENAANPALKKELEDLGAQNATLLSEVESLRKAQDAASLSEAQARESERTLKQELSGMAAEYEALTRDSIQNEKDRDALEASIDKLRDEKEALEMELSDERVKWLGVRSPGAPNGATASPDSTSIRMLREDFRKMMRDRTAEGLRALRAEQEERRKLEAQVRTLQKGAAPPRSNLSKTVIA
ncbi:involucrin repeat protein-like protein [Lophiotrema nucula]|uniref:Involucrin repeat protein-like protein n=1 Tax=Lophiotrema nucula TaxID=690887 RepID=A0A6A5ZB19_9PLEO|nr:involucrin repeat protein-like protein [Lophiotrema nucula]